MSVANFRFPGRSSGILPSLTARSAPFPLFEAVSLRADFLEIPGTSLMMGKMTQEEGLTHHGFVVLDLEWNQATP